MAKYTVSVMEASDLASVVKVIRGVSPLGIGEITKRIGTSKPVVEFDTWAFPPGTGYENGVPDQQEKITEFLSSLAAAGGKALLTHRAGQISEIVSPEMLNNLFESELIHLSQEHD